MKKVVPNGCRIKELRINSERVSTQKELAHEIRVSERKLREIENKNAAISIDVLDRLANCFGVHREQLAKPAGPTAAVGASTVTVSPRAPDVFQDILVDLGKDRSCRVTIMSWPTRRRTRECCLRKRVARTMWRAASTSH